MPENMDENMDENQLDGLANGVSQLVDFGDTKHLPDQPVSGSRHFSISAGGPAKRGTRRPPWSRNRCLRWLATTPSLVVPLQSRLGLEKLILYESSPQTWIALLDTGSLGAGVRSLKRYGITAGLQGSFLTDS